MKSYIKKYLDHVEGFGVLPHELLCEVCTKKPAVDIHHILGKGKYPELKDDIDNLIALCRECHEKYGQKKQYIDFLREKKKYKNE